MSSKLVLKLFLSFWFIWLFTSCGLFTKNYIEGECKGNWKQFEQTVPSNYLNAPQLIGHGFVSSVSVNNIQTEQVLMGTETSGIFHSKNNGKKWRNRTDKLKIPFLGVRQMARVPDNQDIVFAGTAQDSHLQLESYGQGVIQSMDGGKSWFRRLDVLRDSTATFARRNVKAIVVTDSVLFIGFDNSIQAHSVYSPYRMLKSWDISKSTVQYSNISIHSLAWLEKENQLLAAVSVFNRSDQRDLHTLLIKIATDNDMVRVIEPKQFKHALFTQVAVNRGEVYFAQTAVQNAEGIDVPARFELLKWKNDAVESFYRAPIRNTYGQPFAGFGRAKHAFAVTTIGDTTAFFVGGYEVTVFNLAPDTIFVQKPSKTTHVDVRDIQLVKKGEAVDVYQANDGGLAKAEWNKGHLGSWNYLYSKEKPPQISEVLGFTALDDKRVVSGEMHNGIRINGDKSVHLQAGDGGAICKSKVFPNRVYGIVAYGTGAGVLVAFDENENGEWERKASVSIYGREGLKASAPIMCYKNGEDEVVVVGATKPIKATFGKEGTFVSREPVVIEDFNPKSFAISAMDADVESRRMYMAFPNQWACPEGICDYENLWYSNDLGDSWLPMKIDQVKKINPSALSIDNTGKYELFVSGANLSTWDGKVLNKVLSIKGETVIDLTYNLPNVPVFSMAQETNGRLWVGTEYGVYYLEPNSKNWQCYSRGLPPTIIEHIELREDRLWIGTYGRGIWSTKYPK